MKLTFRWYGETDSIPLDYIRQIPNMSGVVSSCYEVKVGEVWPIESLKKQKQLCEDKGLKFEVIESIPVHEDIKLGKPTRDKYIANYIENIRRVASIGVKVICYNLCLYLIGQEQIYIIKTRMVVNHLVSHLMTLKS